MEKQLESKFDGEPRKIRLLITPPVEEKHELNKGDEITVQFGEVSIIKEGKDDEPHVVSGWWHKSPVEFVKLLNHEFEFIDRGE